MAVIEYFQNMYDDRLKPRLLRSLLNDHIPDENQPFPSPSELSKVVSAIKTHGLLNESFRKQDDQRLKEKWQSAIDAWVDRLLMLVSNRMPDKCWAGICLLGVTCQECNTDRFLASYSSWFQKLLSQIQPSSDSQFVKVATCASLSDMITRLSGIPHVKKDGTSLAGKLVQPVLKLLAEDGSVTVWEGAVDLLCTLVKLFPASVCRRYDSAEAVIVSKIMAGKCTANMSKKFGHCLALLPKVRGDEDSWSLLMQKILISINVHLNDAFQGLEEEKKGSDAVRLLVPPGKDPPSPLQAHVSGEVSGQAADISEQVLLSRVSTLMLSCAMMLTNSYPVQVTIPVHFLLALIERVLSVDGSLSQVLMPFTTVMQQAAVCSELPVLHSDSLDLLIAVMKGIRSQLLPNAAKIVNLLRDYFKRCALPTLRIKVYSIMEILLISMGVGIAPYLAQEVTDNAYSDLASSSDQIGVASYSINPDPATYAAPRPSKRKRKHGDVTGSAEDQNRDGLEVDVPKCKPVTPIPVQIAALQTLEALLTVGGALISESGRANIDLLMILVATNACEGGWGVDEKGASVVLSEPASSWTDFQLAALHALLASLLSPARVRPLYLSQGLELFRRGKKEAGTKLAGFCAHALLALEVLIHPRALPLMDSSFSNNGTFEERYDHRFPEDIFPSVQKDIALFSVGGIGVPDPDDELYDSWLGNGEDVDASITMNTEKKAENSGEPSEDRDQQVRENPPTIKLVDDSIGRLVSDGVRNQPTGIVEAGRNADGFMVDPERLNLATAVGNAVVAIDSLSNPDKGAMDNTGSGGLFAPDEGKLPSATTGTEKELMSEDDSDSLGSFPDIVVGDPDSD